MSKMLLGTSGMAAQHFLSSFGHTPLQNCSSMRLHDQHTAMINTGT